MKTLLLGLVAAGALTLGASTASAQVVVAPSVYPAGPVVRPYARPYVRPYVRPVVGYPRYYAPGYYARPALYRGYGYRWGRYYR